MNGSRERPPKERIRHPRAAAEGAGRALRDQMPPPTHSLGEDAVEEAMRRHVDGGCDLGAYVEAEDRSHGNGPVSLDGPAQTIRFPERWRNWFAKQTPARLAALDEMVDERLERAAVRKFFRNLKHLGIAAVIAGFAGARWFSEQIAWFMAKLPILREFWNLITGSAKP